MALPWRISPPCRPPARWRRCPPGCGWFKRPDREGSGRRARRTPVQPSSSLPWPFHSSCILPAPGVFQELFKPGLSFLDLDCADARPLIERRKLPEALPCGRVILQGGKNLRIHDEAGLRHAGQRGAARIRQAPQPLQAPAALLVQIGPAAAFSARREPLGGGPALHSLS